MTTPEEVLEFIRNYVEVTGSPPTVREIRDGLGVSSTSTVQAHLVTLRKRGLIRSPKMKARSIQITSPKEK